MRFTNCCSYQRVNGGSGSIARRKNLARNKVRATAEHLDSASDPIKYNGRAGYHPYEDISELSSVAKGEARLTTAESTRTIVEVAHCTLYVILTLLL